MEKKETYQQAIDFLFNQLPMYQRIGKSAYKANLDNTLAFDQYFDHPHRHFKTIHVTGTNGKGSVSHLLASVLAEAGYKTGLYTSPHLKDFRERIKINGEMISETEVVDFVNQHHVIIEELQPSFFEMTVAMAFDYFARQKVDVAIIEVGLGGRLDSTNIINPCLSIITNIAFDHTSLLGNTLAEIAGEKAGIIKPEIPVVIGQKHPETEPVFEQKAKELNSPILFAEDNYSIDYSMQTAHFEQVFQVYKNDILTYQNLTTALPGWYQRKNAKTVLTAIDQLNKQNWHISNDHIYSGFKNVVHNTGLMGRWQILGTNPLIICDTGHNEDGITQIVAQLKETPYKKLHFVIGMVNDKEIDNVLKLLPTDAFYYFTQASIPRALDVAILAQKAKLLNLNGLQFSSVWEAFEAAKKNAAINDLIFIGGSNFVVAEVL
jgi:dihydrofolate synthase/folylpolyglutamate synthase